MTPECEATAVGLLRQRFQRKTCKDLANAGVPIDVRLARPMVRPPCSIEGAVMRRRVGGARCGACGLGLAIPAPGRLGQPSGPTTRVCLQWLDAGVERKRRKPPWTRGDRSPGPSPEARPRGEKPPQWSAGRRACRVTRHAAPQGARTVKAPFGAPLPHVCEGRKRTADPEARLRASSPRYGRTKKWGR